MGVAWRYTGSALRVRIRIAMRQGCPSTGRSSEGIIVPMPVFVPTSASMPTSIAVVAIAMLRTGTRYGSSPFPAVIIIICTIIVHVRRRIRRRQPRGRRARVRRYRIASGTLPPFSPSSPFPRFSSRSSRTTVPRRRSIKDLRTRRGRCVVQRLNRRSCKLSSYSRRWRR